jgi:hypothetical protein
MAQVFRDLARDAHQRAGAIGVLVVWGRALTDLVQTVPAERSAQMNSRTWQRLGGLCLMIGSIVASVTFIIHRLVGFGVFLGVLAEVWLAVAAALFLPGILALHLRLAGRGGWWRWLGTVLAVVGVLALALGQWVFALHLGGTLTSCGYHCISIEYPAGSLLDERLSAQAQVYGTWLAVVGLGVLSVIALSGSPLSRRTALPGALVVGYTAFMSLPANAPALFPGVELLLVWVGAAFLLGRELWREAAPGISAALPMTEVG